MCIKIHAVPECSVQFGALPLQERGSGFRTDSEKVTELVGMDLLVHTEFLYSVRLQSGNKTAEGAHDRRLQNPRCHGRCGSE